MYLCRKGPIISFEAKKASSLQSITFPNSSVMSSRKNIIKDLVVQVTAVIAGILIALFIDNLRENAQDRRLLESTMQSLLQEFDKNGNEINTVLSRQSKFLDTLLHYRDDDYSIVDIAMKTDGMGTSPIYTTNWQLSLNNNSLRFLNFETVNLLSQIDSKHAEIMQQEGYFTSIAWGPPLFKRGEEGRLYRYGVEQWLKSLIDNENELLELYREFEEIVQTKQHRRK